MAVCRATRMRTVTYAIGDIHGRLDLLDDLLARSRATRDPRRTGQDRLHRRLRRPRSGFSRVIERLMAGPKRSQDEFVCLRGNHDDLFVEPSRRGQGLPDWAWLLYGHTVVSYGLDRETASSSDPTLSRHAEFLAALPLTHDDGTYLSCMRGSGRGWRSNFRPNRICSGSATSSSTTTDRCRAEWCTGTRSSAMCRS